MMSVETIRELSREASEKAAQEGKYPFTYWPEDVLDDDTVFEGMKGFPILGDHVPEGWERVNLDHAFGVGEAGGVYMGDADGYGAYFVDATGLGRDLEPALTVKQFMGHVAAVEESARAQGMGSIGWGIVETGEFQVKVGIFRKIDPES